MRALVAIAWLAPFRRRSDSRPIEYFLAGVADLWIGRRVNIQGNLLP